MADQAGHMIHGDPPLFAGGITVSLPGSKYSYEPSRWLSDTRCPAEPEVVSVAPFPLDEFGDLKYDPNSNQTLLLTWVALPGSAKVAQPLRRSSSPFSIIAGALRNESPLPPTPLPSSSLSSPSSYTPLSPNSLFMPMRLCAFARPSKIQNTSDSNSTMDPEESSSAASPSRPKLPQQRGGNQKTPKRNQPHQAFRGNLPTPAAQQDESQHLSEGKERDMACSSASHGSPSSGPGARQANQGEAATPPTLPPGLKPLWSAVHLPHPRLVPIPPITPYDLTGAYEADDTAPISAIPAAHHTPRSPQASDAGKGKQKETHVNAWATDSDNDSVPDEELEDELRKIGTELMKSYNEGNITKEELNAQLRKKLGAPVISRAHARQYDRLFIEKDKARPEQLPIVRNGPGTDMTSQMYQELARPRLAVGVEEPEKWSIQPPMTIPNAGYEEIDPDENWRTVRKGTHTYHAQWTAYFKSPPVWPVIKEDGKLTLHSKRPKGFIYEEQPFPHCAIFSDNSELAEVNRGPYSCDWWFGVNLPNDKVGILTHFYLWLNCLPEVNHYVNIYHKSFFDGTAVPDGAFGMFIPNAKHLPTPRDMQRKRTALHWHETAAGYMHNKILFLREERRAEIARQEEFRRAREAFLSQPVPKAVPSNVYLRPVEFHDAPGLHRLMNWYMQNSALSSETDPIDEVDARQMVEDCRSNHLPFIVAVERATKTNNNAAEKVLGYAYLSYYMDGKSSNRYTLEMRVYVDHTHKRTHIGRSLVDRILAMCDVMHRATAAHVFEANNHNVSPEGQRYANVVCAIAYPPNRASRYGWVKDWLTREFRFRELGTLHGGRVKFGEALDIWIIFRQTGVVPSTRNPCQYIC